MLCYQPGAGGHFLAGAMGAGYNDVDPTINEYDSNAFSLNLDSGSISTEHENHVDQRDLDVLHGLARHVSQDPVLCSTIDIAIAHEPPCTTAGAFDLRIDEFIVLSSSEEHYWLVESLRWYKHQLCTNYANRHHLIPSILAQNRYNGQINTAEYNKMIKTIRQHTKLNIAGTPFSWLYYLDCKADQRDVYDIAVFHDHLRRHHWNKRTSWNMWCSDYNLQGRAWFSQQASCYTEADYHQLFWLLQRPERGRLSTVDLSDMASYSQRNLYLLNKLVLIAPPEDQEPMRERIAQLGQQLTLARSSL